MSSNSTRWTVIQGAARGVPEDQAEFARRYSPVIRSYLRARWQWTPLFEEVADVTQQVFVECFKENGALTRADPEHGNGFRAYLYGVTRNVALVAERKRARSKERQQDSNFDLDAIAAKEDSLAKVFDRAWAATILRDAVALQLERARGMGEAALKRHRLLVLRFGDGLPIREIAARWNMDAKVLHREYPKAREEFRRALMDVVRDLNGGASQAVESECERLRQYFA